METAEKKLVSVIIPAYKQEKIILKDVKSIDDVMSKTRFDYEIIVVVDGFVDKTYEKVKRIKGNRVKVYGYEKNRGKGYAVRYGMARSKGDYVVFIDSGMDINPGGIFLLLEHLEWYNADIIIASKRHPASKINYPFIRRFYSWGYQILVRILFGLRVRDTQSGLKVFRREVLEKVLPRLLVEKFAFDVEILAVSRFLGFKRIYEAPIQIKWGRGGTSFTPFLILDKNIRSMIRDTLAVFYRLRVLNYYSDKRKKRWICDKDLDMKIVNTGGVVNE